MQTQIDFQLASALYVGLSGTPHALIVHDSVDDEFGNGGLDDFDEDDFDDDFDDDFEEEAEEEPILDDEFAVDDDADDFDDDDDDELDDLDEE